LIWRGLVSQFVVIVLLFIPAGTFQFWQAWAFMAVNLFLPALMVVYFYKRDPQFLERRMLKKEKSGAQKLLVKLGLPIYFASFLLPGLDFRFGWSRRFLEPVPPWLTVLALVLIFGSHLFIFWVWLVNRYAARIVHVEAGQTVVDTGPYRWVRHPMYSASILISLCAPLALGSFVALAAFWLFIPLLAMRLLDEEEILRKELPGYSDYCQRTPWRLVPFVW
jgi:protein-S-isoprenylcysteine O-methyltransferase Ste14